MLNLDAVASVELIPRYHALAGFLRSDPRADGRRDYNRSLLCGFVVRGSCGYQEIGTFREAFHLAPRHLRPRAKEQLTVYHCDAQVTRMMVSLPHKSGRDEERVCELLACGFPATLKQRVLRSVWVKLLPSNRRPRPAQEFLVRHDILGTPCVLINQLEYESLKGRNATPVAES